MKEKETKVIKKSIQGFDIIFECEPCEGEYLDTRVIINGERVCWITFTDIDKFCREFEGVFAKYRI